MLEITISIIIIAVIGFFGYLYLNNKKAKKLSELQFEEVRDEYLKFSEIYHTELKTKTTKSVLKINSSLFPSKKFLIIFLSMFFEISPERNDVRQFIDSLELEKRKPNDEDYTFSNKFGIINISKQLFLKND